MNRIRLWIELIGLYVGLPLLYFFKLIPWSKLLTLIVVFMVLGITLLRDKSFNRASLVNVKLDSGAWKKLALRFLLLSGVLAGAIVILCPHLFIVLIKKQPFIWLGIILLYPWLSACPQEVIYRVYFFHRYCDIVKNKKLLVVINVILFSFLHVIYFNWVAVVFALVGGYLFSTTFLKTRSLPAAMAEHALYGMMIFSIGLGQYFLKGV